MTGKTLGENLRQIGEALKVGNNRAYWEHNEELFNDALQALSSLRSLLESDAGEDYGAIKYTIENQTRGQTAFAALSRLSLKAKLGEAEILKAKREVLEEALYKTQSAIGLSNACHELKKLIAALDNGI